MRYTLTVPAATLSLVGCTTGPPPAVVPAPAGDTVTVVDTVVLQVPADADEALEARLAALQFQVLERDAQIVELQQKLDAAMQEVVRAMARLQTVASRAEAASAMAEAEIALEGVTDVAGGQGAPEVAQAVRLLEMSTTAFVNQNYGGALYLASQARSIARSGRIRFGGADPGARQPGEVLFAVPIPLQAGRRSNVREGPGLGFRILFTLEPGARLVGHSYVGRWVRVTDEQDRAGWIFHTLIEGRSEGRG